VQRAGDSFRDARGAAGAGARGQPRQPVLLDGVLALALDERDELWAGHLHASGAISNVVDDRMLTGASTFVNMLA
jgi:hypothetical protein